jgi:hypothetical protein
MRDYYIDWFYHSAQATQAFNCNLAILGHLHCLILALGSSADLPSFEWVDDASSALPLLKITFPDGNEDDFAVLKHFDIIPTGRNEDPATVDNCIYDGYLTNENNVYVTLTGGCVCSKTFDVGSLLFLSLYHYFSILKTSRLYDISTHFTAFLTFDA